MNEHKTGAEERTDAAVDGCVDWNNCARGDACDKCSAGGFCPNGRKNEKDKK